MAGPRHLLGLAVAVVVATAGAARAGGQTHKVTVESEPPGAHVYFNDIDSGAVCEKTPCTVDAPVGDYPIILRLDNYTPFIETLVVPKNGKKRLTVHYKLQAAVGTLTVDNPAAKGAVIAVGGVEKAKVDAKGIARVELDAGDYQVTVTLNGKQLYDGFVELDADSEHALPLTVGAATGDAHSDGKSDGDGTTTEPPTIVKTATPQARDRFISLDVVVSVAFRYFSYQQPTTGPLFPESEEGQILVGPAVEFWPAELAGWSQLRNLSLFVRLELPVNHQTVVDATNTSIGATTQWDSFEASVRQRWRIGEMAAVEVNGGYVRDAMIFSGTADELQKLPEATYQSLRAGGRAGLVVGAFEPYVAIEGRYVLDGGVLPTRFAGASAIGFKAALGLTARFGPLYGRAEASDLHYGWSFTNTMQPGLNAASGATDKVLGVSFLFGYLY